MPVYRDKKKGTWFVVLRYTDFTGTLRQTTKRGFRTKSDGKDYERRFLLQKSHDLTMNFEDFYYLYMSSVETRLRESTLCMKKSRHRNKDPALLQKQADVRYHADRYH